MPLFYLLLMLSPDQIFVVALFAIVLVLIVTEAVHRTLAALLGASIVLISGVLPFELAMDYVDFNTLGVLSGMMLFVAAIKPSGIFEVFAMYAAKIAKGSPWRIMLYLMLLTAVFSAFLDNVTTVLLIGPMTLMICKDLKLNPVPYFISQIIFSNVGGTATLIGDPPNIMIASEAGLSFNDFLLIDGPIVVLLLPILCAILWFIFRNHLASDSTQEQLDKFLQVDPKHFIKSKYKYSVSIILLLILVVSFFNADAFNLSTAVVALGGAALAMLTLRSKVVKVIESIEWTTIGFFAGLFIIVGALVKTGVIEQLANLLIAQAGDDIILMMLVILIASAILSSIIDNIPYVATVIPLILTLQSTGMDVTPLWWALSLGACLGGNGTLIGASANVVLSDISNKSGHPITYMSYLRFGLPIMLLTITISAVYLLLRFA